MGGAASSDINKNSGKNPVHPGLKRNSEVEMSKKVSFSNESSNDSNSMHRLSEGTKSQPPLRSFTMEEVAKIKQMNPSRKYVIVSNELYDVTDFAPSHPGGSSVFDINNGKDVTETFESIHSPSALTKLSSVKIGKIKVAEEEVQSEKGTGEKEEKTISMGEIRKRHEASKDNIIIIMFGYAYDVSDFAFTHAGGFTTLWNQRGKECGEIFMRIHGNRAKEMCQKMCLGRVSDMPAKENPLAKFAKPAPPPPSSSSSSSKGQLGIDQSPAAQKTLAGSARKTAAASRVTRLDSRVLSSYCSTLSKDYKYISFSIPEKLITPPGGHVKIYSNPRRNEGRYYTPYSIEETQFHVCMKVYQGGQTSPVLSKKALGDSVQFEGPYDPSWIADKDAVITDTSVLPSQKHVFMAAGGTGITPLYAMAKDLMERQLANVTIFLSIRTSFDVLLDMELQELLQAYGVPSDQREADSRKCYLIVFAAITQPLEDDRLTWAKSFNGRIDANMFAAAEVGASDVALLCGPSAFNDSVKAALLEKNLCKEKRIHYI